MIILPDQPRNGRHCTLTLCGTMCGGRRRCSPIRFSGYASEQYHVDPAKQDAAVLAFRDYGDDLLGRLLGAGFASAQFLTPEQAVPWGFTRTLAVARKAGAVTDSPL